MVKDKNKRQQSRVTGDGQSSQSSTSRTDNAKVNSASKIHLYSEPGAKHLRTRRTDSISTTTSADNQQITPQPIKQSFSTIRSTRTVNLGNLAASASGSQSVFAIETPRGPVKAPQLMGNFANEDEEEDEDNSANDNEDRATMAIGKAGERCAEIASNLQKAISESTELYAEDLGEVDNTMLARLVIGACKKLDQIGTSLQGVIEDVLKPMLDVMPDCQRKRRAQARRLDPLAINWNEDHVNAYPLVINGETVLLSSIGDKRAVYDYIVQARPQLPPIIVGTMNISQEVDTVLQAYVGRYEDGNKVFLATMLFCWSIEYLKYAYFPPYPGRDNTIPSNSTYTALIPKAQRKIFSDILLRLGLIFLKPTQEGVVGNRLMIWLNKHRTHSIDRIKAYNPATRRQHRNMLWPLPVSEEEFVPLFDRLDIQQEMSRNTLHQSTSALAFNTGDFADAGFGEGHEDVLMSENGGAGGVGANEETRGSNGEEQNQPQQ